MTSEMTQLHKPALPPKPVKYRAPPPPTSSSSVSRVSPSPAVKKYRAPAPPAVRPPPPPTASASSAPGKSTMRREPMQVLPCNVASYERCRSQSDAKTTTTTTNDSIIVNGPRPGRVIEDVCLRHREPLNESASTAVEAPDRVIADVLSAADKQDESKSDIDTVKPVVRDVKLWPRNSAVTSSARHQRTVRSWRSTESIDRLITSANAANGGGGPATRSSFVDPATTVSTSAARRSVYIDLGDYQTLLKHGRQDAVYSLPQPHCYGDDTLRAVKLITEKYDTFKRRQMRAMSFRDAAGGGAAVKASRQQSYAEDDVIAEGFTYVKTSLSHKISYCNVIVDECCYEVKRSAS